MQAPPPPVLLVPTRIRPRRKPVRPARQPRHDVSRTPEFRLRKTIRSLDEWIDLNA